MFATTFHVTICTKQKGQNIIHGQQTLTTIISPLGVALHFILRVQSGRGRGREGQDRECGAVGSRLTIVLRKKKNS